MTNFEKVGLFMKTFGQEVKANAGFPSEKINTLRINLIEEELEELKDAITGVSLSRRETPSGDASFSFVNPLFSFCAS